MPLHPLDDESSRGPLLKAHLGMCKATESALKECISSGTSEEGTLPEACNGAFVQQMECAIQKRESAMKFAIKLAGKEKVEKHFPYYEENMKKSIDLLELYKQHDGKGNADKFFWQPSM